MFYYLKKEFRRKNKKWIVISFILAFIALCSSKSTQTILKQIEIAITCTFLFRMISAKFFLFLCKFMYLRGLPIEEGLKIGLAISTKMLPHTKSLERLAASCLNDWRYINEK